MRFVGIAIFFFLAVGGFTLSSKYFLRGNVEAELHERASRLLHESGFEGVEVEFDHNTAVVSGYVDSTEEKSEVIGILKKGIPAAHWPEVVDTGLTIRPTLTPWIRVTRSEGSDRVKVEGVLSENEESGKVMLGSRLHPLTGVRAVENLITLDPRHRPFPKMAEFSSLSSTLLTHSTAAEISLEENTLKLTGTVPNDGIKNGILDLARRITDVPAVSEIKVELPDVFLRSSELKLTRNRFGITLTGILPEESDKAAIMTAIKASDSEVSVSDRISVAGDCSRASWQGSLPSLIPLLLSKLSGEMTAEFSDSQIRLHGNAAKQADLEAIMAGLPAIPEGERKLEVLADISVGTGGGSQIEAVQCTAVFEGGMIALKGTLPGKELLLQLEEKIGKAHPNVSVKNEIAALPAAPGTEWFSGLPEFLVEVISRSSSATISIDGGQLVMEGRTLALSDKQILQNLAVNMLPSTIHINNLFVHADQPFPKPALLPEARTQLGESLKPLSVFFDASSDVLKSEEKTKVASIAEILKKTEAELDLVITGFADNVGNQETNRELSLRRAKSVMEELVRLKIEESSMELDSKVEDVSQMSRSERGKARRVEVSLKPASE